MNSIHPLKKLSTIIVVTWQESFEQPKKAGTIVSSLQNKFPKNTISLYFGCSKGVKISNTSDMETLSTAHVEQGNN